MRSCLFYATGLTRLVCLFLILPLATLCAGAPQTNSTAGWNDTFENYTNQTPLIDGTNGWYASSANCIVSAGAGRSDSQAAMIPVDVTLSNRFDDTYTRIVSIEMYVKPQLYNGTNYPDISSTNNDLGLSTNSAAQFFINSNGYFVVANGTNWRTLTKMADGSDARPVTTSYYSRVQVNLRYKNHTWNLKAWTNDTYLVASTPFINFTSPLNTFGGFDIYNGSSTSYLDEVSVTNIDYSLLPKFNGVPLDAILKINGAQPAAINGVTND